MHLAHLPHGIILLFHFFQILNIHVQTQCISGITALNLFWYSFLNFFIHFEYSYPDIVHLAHLPHGIFLNCDFLLNIQHVQTKCISHMCHTALNLFLYLSFYLLIYFEYTYPDIVHLAHLPHGSQGYFGGGAQKGVFATFSGILQQGDWTYMQVDLCASVFDSRRYI